MNGVHVNKLMDYYFPRFVIVHCTLELHYKDKLALEYGVVEPVCCSSASVTTAVTDTALTGFCALKCSLNI